MALLQRTIGIAGLLAGFLALGGLLESRRDPDVHRVRLALADWPKAAPPIKLALLSDIHIGNASMDSARLGRIVDRVNAEQADLVVIAGDFIAGEVPGSARRRAPALVGPLSRLHARLGVVAVPGNHDHGTGVTAVAQALNRAKITLLANQLARRGPVTLVGIDTDAPGAEPKQLVALARTRDSAVIAVAHYPQAEALLPAGVPLLAAHTHCGQVVLPWIGPIARLARPRMRLDCGVVRGRDHLLIVTGGLGTSGLPFRIGAPPDYWIVTLGPKAS